METRSGAELESKETWDRVVIVAGNRADQRRPHENEVNGLWPWDLGAGMRDKTRQHGMMRSNVCVHWGRALDCNGYSVTGAEELDIWRRSVPYHTRKETK